MAAVRHLGFVVRVFGPPTKGMVVFIAVQNLVGIGAVVLMICTFSILRVWLENAYSRPKNWGFWGILPINGEQCQRNPKRHILARVRVV